MARFLEIGLCNAVMAGLLAIFAAVLCRLYRRPAFIHAIWLLVLVRLISPPLVLVSLPWLASPEADVPTDLPFVLESTPEGSQPAEPALIQVTATDLPTLDVQVPTRASDSNRGLDPGHWRKVVVVLWFSGSALILVGIVRSVLRFKRVLGLATKAGPDLQALVKELAGRMKLRRQPEIWLLPGTFSPMLWALARRPRLLLPAELLQRLDRNQVSTIILHELAHWRRRDHWVRFLELAVTVCYWWHPVVWWARRELHEAEEQCCDAWVTRVLVGSERTYGLALLETVAFLSKARLPLPASASGIGQVYQLRRRLTMIMSGQKRGTLTWVGCAALLVFAVLLLPFISVQAQVPEKKEAKGAIIVDVDGTFDILLAGDPAPDQEAIELLKRALKLLAERKQASAGAMAPQQANPQEIANSRRQVELLTLQVTALRQQLVATEQNLRQAQARLAALQGGAGAKPIPMQIELKVHPEKGAVKGKDALDMILELKDGKAIRARLGEKKAPSPEEINARLERLLREAEELRKEIKKPETRPPELKDAKKELPTPKSVPRAPGLDSK